MRWLPGLVLAASACGRVGFDDQIDAAAGNGSSWGPPVALDTLNTFYNEVAPALSADGLEVYFASTRTSANYRLFHAKRVAIDQPFAPPTELVIGNAAASSEPELTSDGQRLYFRLNSSSIAHSDAMVPPDTWADATTSPELVGFEGIDLGVADTHAVVDKGDQIYEATRPDRASSFAPPVILGELDVPLASYPALSADGLELWCEGGTPPQIWRATRPSLAEPFTPAQPVAVAPEGAPAGDPEVSEDGTLLLFVIITEAGDYDIYQVSRQRP